MFVGLSVAGNLGLLFSFKYVGFFVENLRSAAELVGVNLSLAPVDVVLPLGISFFTFQTMSYTLDVYRGRLEPRRDLLEYMVFVSFFPQLVAGPIERAATMFPQIERMRTFAWDRFGTGLSLALWGGFQKVVLADNLAVVVTATFADGHPTAAMVWAASAAYVVQLFCDFAGYTDIARGTARMLGFELRENFDQPFLAASPSEWWNRWHMSFNTWMRDYVFQPLAIHPWFRRLWFPGTGSRGHALRAMFVTMLIAGLWHGASWNFVLWGALFGTANLVWVLVGSRLPVRVQRWKPGRIVLVPLMWLLTTFSALLFRVPDVAQIARYLALDPFGGEPRHWTSALVTLSLTASCVTPLLLAWAFDRFVQPRLAPGWELPIRTTATAAVAWVVLTLHRGATSDFVYFQF